MVRNREITAEEAASSRPGTEVVDAEDESGGEGEVASDLSHVKG